MHKNDRTTPYVDFQHVQTYKQVLADSIAAHFHPAEP